MNGAVVALMMGGLVAMVSGDAWAKAPIHGLVTMGSLGFLSRPQAEPVNDLREAEAHPGLYAGAVILATWEQLEPARGQFDFTVIDQALAAIRGYNAAHPKTPLVGKLRVFAGLHAPDWVKAFDGGPMQLQHAGETGSFGHFWSKPYREAWRGLQSALAARFDAEGLLDEVAVSSCASVTGEPFIVPLSRENLAALEGAGYSNAAMQDCLAQAPDDYTAWRQTAVDYTFNPWREVEGGRLRPDTAFPIEVMQHFRQQFGPRGVIANHGLAPEMNPGADALLEAMQALGPPIEFQTRSPNEDWDAAVARGERVGMTELEIWNTRAAGGPAQISPDQLRAWHDQLAR